MTLGLSGGCASVHSRTSVDIDRRIETAWAVFADQDRLDEWLFGLGRLPWISRDPEIGSVHRVTLGEKGQMTLVQTVTAIRTPELFAFDLEHEWMLMTSHFRLEPRGADACTLHWDATIRPKGIWRTFLVNTWRPSIEKRYEEHLAQLRTLIEAEPATP